MRRKAPRPQQGYRGPYALFNRREMEAMLAAIAAVEPREAPLNRDLASAREKLAAGLGANPKFLQPHP